MATTAMVRGLEPFATWYYPFAWYATLLALDGLVALRGGPPAEAHGAPVPQRRFLLLGRPGYLASLLGWSAVTWLFFELLNFRLRNWYYVFVPEDPVSGSVGVLLSFATVLPALFAAEAALASFGVASGARSPALRVTPWLLAGMRIAGGLSLTLPLLWPRLFFPLVWGAAALLLEPVNYRRDPGRSLLGDLERGRPGRLLRLLVAGALVGLLWELYNVRARGKWIYTVPGLEELKLFEMPALGFLGFPPFTLECFAIWQALVLGGLAVPRAGSVRAAPAAVRAAAAVGAIAFSVAVLAGIDAHTISSTTPSLSDLPGVPAGALGRAGYDVLTLARARPEEVAAAVRPGPRVGLRAVEHGGFGRGERVAEERQGTDPVSRPDGADSDEPGEVREWIESARLAALRGIGTDNARRLRAAGVRSVEDLAAADPALLVERLKAAAGYEVVPARVRVWVRAAREAVATGAARPAGAARAPS